MNLSVLTKKQHARYQEEYRQECKRLKRQGRHRDIPTFDNYVKSCFGKTQSSKKSFQEYQCKKPEQYRETPDYPSLDERSGTAEKNESTKYTGSLIIGVATMHKSNAVPIMNQEQATDIAKMRRN